MKDRRKLFEPTPFKIGCLTVLMAGLLYLAPGGDRSLLVGLDNQIFNGMFRWRGQVATTGQVVIVDIDEKSLRAVGQWPWPRSTLAELVTVINAAGARVIGFDMVFAEPDRTSPVNYLGEFEQVTGGRWQVAELQGLGGLDHDQLLGEAVARAPTVLGYVFQTRDDGLKRAEERPFPAANIRINPTSFGYGDIALYDVYRAVVNIDAVARAATEGFLNVFPDDSGMVRKVPLFMRMDGVVYPALALEMVRLGLERDDLTLQVSGQGELANRALLGVSLADRLIPTDEVGQAALNFRGPVYSFDYLSAVDVLQGGLQARLKDKYVLLGTSAAGLYDLMATPFSSIYPGVEVHATLIDNILRGDLLTHDPYTEKGIILTVILLFGIILSAVLAFCGPLTGALSAILVILLLVVGHYRLFFLNHEMIGLAYPLVTLGTILPVVTFCNYFFEGREKRFIKTAFGRYLSPLVIKELISRPEQLSLKGEDRELTIFFSDIRNFTTIAEQISSATMARLLNEYLTEMSDIIMDHKGLVDKYIGDAIMAIWGAPLADPDQAANAIRAALAMLTRLRELRNQWEQEGLPFIDIGIGINTGIVSVGNFGSSRRFDYTVIGDNVNVASRLEGINKMYGTNLLISQFTRQELGDRFFCREIDRVRVKGKREVVVIYEPLVEGEPEPRLRLEVENFEAALALYRARRFEPARQAISRLHQERPQAVYELYLNRIAAYLATPPPADWDGAFVFRRKE